MRRIVMFNRVTADGYFAGPDGNLDWVVPEPAIDRMGADAIPGVDTVLFGRRTYELFAQFWPHAADDAGAADPHGARQLSPEQRAMARGLNEMTKLVFSTTLRDVTWKNSRIVRTLDPAEIQAMKQQPGKDMIIFGSGSIVSQLTQHRLIDEYQVIVSPLILGRGQPLFTALPKRVRLDLLEAQGFRSGNVLLRYAPSR
jgi:dihydrofolate reductase